jgi:hypothetical protein
MMDGSMDAERYSAQLEGESNLAPSATVSSGSCQPFSSLTPAVCVHGVLRALRVFGRTRVVCGRAPNHSDPSADRQGANARDQG